MLVDFHNLGVSVSSFVPYVNFLFFRGISGLSAFRPMSDILQLASEESATWCKYQEVTTEARFPTRAEGMRRRRGGRTLTIYFPVARHKKVMGTMKKNLIMHTTWSDTLQHRNASLIH